MHRQINCSLFIQYLKVFRFLFFWLCFHAVLLEKLLCLCDVCGGTSEGQHTGYLHPALRFLEYCLDPIAIQDIVFHLCAGTGSTLKIFF